MIALATLTLLSLYIRAQDVAIWSCECLPVTSMAGVHRPVKLICPAYVYNPLDEVELVMSALVPPPGIVFEDTGTDQLVGYTVKIPQALPAMFDVNITVDLGYIDPREQDIGIIFRLAVADNPSIYQDCTGYIRQLEPELDTITSTISIMGDFMGSFRGPNNDKDWTSYLNPYLRRHGSEIPDHQDLRGIHISSGNLFGESVWESKALEDGPIGYFASAIGLVIANIGDMELTLGKAYLDNTLSQGQSLNFISTNIYWASTNDRVFSPYGIVVLEPFAAWYGIDVLRLAFFGVMTRETTQWIHPAIRDQYDIRDDYLSYLQEECQNLKHRDYGVQCILLVAGGMNPLLDFTDELHQNTSEFAQLVNALTSFDVIVGSRTGVQRTVKLPDNRVIIQTLPHGESVGHVKFTRPPIYTMYPTITTEFELVIDEDASEGDEKSASEMLWETHVTLSQSSLAAVKVEELGVYTGPVNIGIDPETSRTSYSYDSPLANLIAEYLFKGIRSSQSSLLMENSNAFAMFEPNIALRGLRAEKMEERVFTSAHLTEILARPEDNLVIAELTGQQIWDIFAQQWTENGEFLWLATHNIDVVYDKKRPGASQMISITIDNTPVLKSDEKSYSLVTSDYLWSGALGHTVLAAVEPNENHDGDSMKISPLFEAQVREFPMEAPEAKSLNGTIVIPRDCVLQVAFPNNPPESSTTPFRVDLSVRSKTGADLEGPFIFYRRDTGETLGRLEEIESESASIVTFNVFLSNTYLLLDIYATHLAWEDQSYTHDVGFAVNLPPLATPEEEDGNNNTGSGAMPNFALLYSLILPLLFIN